MGLSYRNTNVTLQNVFKAYFLDADALMFGTSSLYKEN